MERFQEVERCSRTDVLAAFLQAGACFGFSDVAVARSRGVLLPEDAALFFLTPIVLFGLLGCVAQGLDLAWRGTRNASGRPAAVGWRFLVCLAPVVLQGMRGCVFGCGFGPGQWVLRFGPTLVLVCVVALGHRLVRGQGPGFFLLLSLITALSTLSFETRFDVVGAGAPPFAISFSGWTALGIAGALALTLIRPFQWTPFLGLLPVAAVAAISSPAFPAPTSSLALPTEKATQSVPEQPANVLLIVLDTARADRLPPTPQRRVRTPVLDKFARSSYVFSMAIASSDYSLPSHGSLLTGVLPGEHGAHPIFAAGSILRTHAPLDRSISTYAERLRARGFATTGTASNFGLLTRATGLQRGFDWFDDRPRRMLKGSPLAVPVLSVLATQFGPPFAALQPYRAADEILSLLQKQLERTRSPFFAFANLMDAHEPRVPRSPRKLGAGSTADVLSYDDAIEFMDHELGRLLSWMDDQGLLRSTYVIVTADHGEFLGEQNQWGHMKGGLGQLLIHVPLLIRPPGGLTESVRIDRPFGLFRVMELVTGGATGFTQLLAPATEPELLSEAWSFPGGGALQSVADQRAIFLGNLKLIAGRKGERRLFDLAQDPAEEHNVWTSLDVRLANQFEALARKPVIELRREKTAPDPEAMERLRALGYARP